MTGHGWDVLDPHLSPDVRRALEEQLWTPIAAGATLEALLDDPVFLSDAGRHPAMFADHGVVHVRDVAVGLLRLLDTVEGVLLPVRPPARRRFVATVGVALTYLHDIGMADLSTVGRRAHAAHGAHAAFGPESDALVHHLAEHPDVGGRLAAVGRVAPFAVPDRVVLREVLALTYAHSKSAVGERLLADRRCLRTRIREVLSTPMAEHRRAAGAPADDVAPWPADRLAHVVAHDAAFAWLSAEDGPQAELADDVLDAVRLLRAADVLRQRGSTLRTSGGFEVFLDAATAHAVSAMRPADGSATHLVTLDSLRAAGESNIRVAFVTPAGDLRIAVGRGRFPDASSTVRAVEAVVDTVLDIQGDVLPAFSGTPARGLPPPHRAGSAMRVEVERPSDAPEFADAVVEGVLAREPLLRGRVLAVADVEGARPEERRRYHAAHPVDAQGPEGAALRAELVTHGVDLGRNPVTEALAEVRRACVAAGEVVLERGSPPAFVYVPLGPGLVVRPGGGYPEAHLPAWVPVGTTGVVRRSERNADVVAERRVAVLVVPADRYLRSWCSPLTARELRARLTGQAVS